MEIMFVVVTIALVACSAWSTKKNFDGNRLMAVAIYSLYKELKRYNDNVSGEEKEQSSEYIERD